MAGIDLTRAPLGEVALVSLVGYVAGLDDAVVERHYLEAKSDVEPTSKAGLAKIAKFILGAANRMPDKAAEVFEGYAVILLGVGADGVCGVSQFETFRLVDGLQPYLTPSGPRWDFHRIPVDGKTVLAVIVDPPQWGDPIYVAHKETTEFLDGAVLIRTDGASRSANGREFDLLRGREARQSPRVGPGQLTVSTIGGEARQWTCNDDVLTDYIRKLRKLLGEPAARSLLEPSQPPATVRRFRAPTTDPIPAHVRQGLKQAAEGARLAEQLSNVFRKGVLGVSTDDRTPEEFLEELDQWERELTDRWGGIVAKTAAGSTAEPLRLHITNAGETFLEDVELTLQLPPPLTVMKWTEEPALHDALPRRPNQWLKPTDPYAGTIAQLTTPGIMPQPKRTPTVTYKNLPAGGATITINVGDLRGAGTHTSQDRRITLILDNPVPEPGELFCPWSVTARGHHEVYRGQTAITITEPQDITPRVRDALGMPD